jgi:hypothetical protein
MEAGYNTSTVALPVVEGDEKNPMLGGTTGPPCHWGTYVNTESLSSRLWGGEGWTKEITL